MRRRLVILLALVLLATVAGILLWRGLQSDRSTATDEVRIYLRLDAPGGQPMARGTPVFLSASLSARTRPTADLGAREAEDGQTDSERVRLGSKRRPWWRDLRLVRRVGEANEEVAFSVVPRGSQPYVEVGTDEVGLVRLLLPPDHDLPTGPVILEASWQTGEISGSSRPVTLDIRSDSPAQSAAAFNARYFLDVEELEKATEILEEALASYPDNAALHSLRGRAFEESGELRKAAEAYSRALDLAMERLPADAQEPPTIFIGQLKRVRTKMAERRANR